MVGEQPYKSRDRVGSDSGLGHLLVSVIKNRRNFVSANASADELGLRATSATLNATDTDGSSTTNLKNQHFMKKVL